MRWLTSLASLLWFATFVSTQDVIAQELTLKGDTSIVKVARTITVYDERTAIKSFPFTVESPKGSIRPSWIVPAGVVWSAKGLVLTVTAAPKGDVTITAEWTAIDFEKKAIQDVTASIVVLVGVDPPLPPPPPIPPPISSTLQKSLQAAFNADLDTNKLTKVGKFADILDGVAGAAKGKVKTAGEFVALTHQATDLAIGAGSIPTIRNAVGAYLQTVLPREANTPANDAYFAKVASEHGYVALALRGIK